MLRWMARHIAADGERIEWATIMEDLEINVAHIQIAEINERAFKATTTLPFPSLIFHFCREMDSLRANVGALLGPAVEVPVSSPTVTGDDVVMTALFGDTMPPPYSSHTTRKRPLSGHTFDIEEARRLRKKERE
ncbi:hypothetical protein MTR67_048461 [Solanum verrucosum]|uniref:Integrase core domain containing protein n=1 Tax=Solanum verrucosum TaxID=315347 RepID=A0AAF0V1M9_SOLVR|nr:hypothetical protein MTR67_048461 [Solanum verrucosum]